MMITKKTVYQIIKAILNNIKIKVVKNKNGVDVFIFRCTLDILISNNFDMIFFISFKIVSSN